MAKCKQGYIFPFEPSTCFLGLCWKYYIPVRKWVYLWNRKVFLNNFGVIVKETLVNLLRYVTEDEDGT